MQVTTFGRYQLLDLIGRGTTGKVYRANDSVTNEVVAVKVLKAELEEDPQFVKQFRRELPKAAGLTNSHVVRIHNYGQIGGQLYVDMQLIDGSNLGRLVRNEGGRLLPARAVAITALNAGGIPGEDVEGRGGEAFRWAARCAARLSPGKGCWPVKHLCSTHASE